MVRQIGGDRYGAIAEPGGKRPCLVARSVMMDDDAMPSRHEAANDGRAEPPRAAGDDNVVRPRHRRDQKPISASTSRRLRSSSRNAPIIRLVTIPTPGVRTPRAVMQAGVAWIRSEERRVGNECGRTCRAQWSQST